MINQTGKVEKREVPNQKKATKGVERIVMRLLLLLLLLAG